MLNLISVTFFIFLKKSSSQFIGFASDNAFSNSSLDILPGSFHCLTSTTKTSMLYSINFFAIFGVFLSHISPSRANQIGVLFKSILLKISCLSSRSEPSKAVEFSGHLTRSNAPSTKTSL